MESYLFVFFALISLLLFVGLMKWAHYLIENKYITECFVNLNEGRDTTHSVDLPLTTKTSCKNMCGPLGRCSITGEQCSSDVDCYGCQPTTKGPTFMMKHPVRGNNDAGKYAMISPNYSALTTDPGTKAKLITMDRNSRAATYMKGTNVWRDPYDASYQLFEKRYKSPKNTEINYSNRYSISGEFVDQGPLAANAYMS